MNIKEIIQRLRTAMDDARGQESHFESWLTQNEGICDAIDALKELDKTEQEPVAWVCHGTHGHHDIDFLEEDVDSLSVGTQLYTTPPQRKPLTDEDIWEALGGIDCTRPMLIARAIEAAHGIKGEA